MALLEVTNIKKIYSTRFGGNKVQALSNVTFSVEEGEFVAIMGESGSGKTTLLNILASLDRPTSGEVLLEGKNIVYLTEKEISAFRRKNLGFVFQDFNLLDTFSLRDNIYLPLVLTGEDYREMEQKIRPIAQALKITELLDKFPYEVSGGQKQRAAVARALITNPKLAHLIQRRRQHFFPYLAKSMQRDRRSLWSRTAHRQPVMRPEFFSSKMEKFFIRYTKAVNRVRKCIR